MTRAETEYSMSKTSVWWDIENCEVPKGWDAHTIAQNVSSALLKMGYCGPVSISAYGDTSLIPLPVQQALSSTGVTLNHVPAGVKDASDKKILVDMLLWAIDNPAPANFLLISGDRDFSNALHQLSMRRYTILLARPPHASAPLVAAAENVWLWTSLASGGPPLTSVESSRCSASNSNHEASKDAVSEQAQSSKPTGSTSDSGDTKDHKNRENNVPRGLNQASRKAQASAKAKCVQEAEVLEPVFCNVCQISCTSKDGYVKHTYGKRHRNNLELQSGKSGNMSWGTVEIPKEVLEKQKNKKKASEVVRAKPNAGFDCRLCNVVCHSLIDFDSHLRGQRHAAALLTQSEALADSKKLQEKGVGAKDQPKETIAEPKQIASYSCRLCNVVCQRQSVFDSHLRGQRHAAALLSQSNVLNESKKLQEKGVGEKDQPREAIAEPQLHSQNAQENSNCFEKHVGIMNQSEALVNARKLEEKVFIEKAQAIETIAETQLQSQNLSQGANEHLGEVKKKQKEMMVRRLCNLCVVICDSKGFSTVVCDSKARWTTLNKRTMAAFIAGDDAQSSVSTKPVKEAEDLQPVWCQVCQISCNSKVVYANHTYGKKHRQKLELLSAKNENMSKGPDKLSKENAEKKKKEHVDSKRTRQKFDQEKPSEALEKKLIVDSKIQEESDLEKETTEEHTLIKTDDLGLQGAQEDKEEVKEINAISENLAPTFTEPSRESRILKDSRGCLDVLPERVQVAPDVNVTEKLEDESKHKPESPGRKEQPPGEAAKREEIKGQVDNFWTRLWGKKS
uniref:Meiosis arrest female protein 1 n=1 Tax=Noccaea caerulescens TaxID=107243 RepID=A0A1J3GLW8_NOCCA